MFMYLWEMSSFYGVYDVCYVENKGGEDSGVAKVNKDMVGYTGYGLS